MSLYTTLDKKHTVINMPTVMYKKIGETPLECLDRLRLERPELADVPMTYAGRLDPTAEGVLLVLVGEECKNREKFLELEKEYVCEILWGFSTDTYDILGKVQKTALQNIDVAELKSKLPEICGKFIGKIEQKFPPYSSKPVQGKPLHEWAREGRLGEIEIPSKEIEIKSLEILDTKSVGSLEIEKEILTRLALVHGDFRQKEITALWKNRLEKMANEVFVSKIRVVCSSGTYIRGLVEEMGKMSGCGAVVLSLARTRVGDYR